MPAKIERPHQMIGAATLAYEVERLKYVCALEYNLRVETAVQLEKVNDELARLRIVVDGLRAWLSVPQAETALLHRLMAEFDGKGNANG